MSHNTVTPVVRIRPGVKAFIVHESKILVVKERITGKNGTSEIIHDLPGGGIELGESMEETVKREVFEEVGLKISVERPVGSWEFFIENPRSGSVHILCVGYQCSLVGEKAIDTSNNPAHEDIFEAVWMSKAELLTSQDILRNKEMRQSLENVRV